MSQIKRNILANIAGNGWMALMSLGFVPLYIHFMGIEAYGLIGVFGTLQGTFSLLDMGLSTTMSQEMARLSAQRDKAQEMRDFLRMLEAVYWMVAVIISIIVLVLAPLIARHWVQADQLSPQTLQQAIVIMGIVMGFRWPLGCYSGGLMGLQRQVLINGINASVATLQGAGAVLILWLISPTIQAFFMWQIMTGALQTFLMARFLWGSLPYTGKSAGFRKEILRDRWMFAAGMSGISLTAWILTQVDKIILSRLLTLQMFGYYTLAGAVAAQVPRLFGPAYSAIYPRITQLAALNDQEGLKKLYHRSCQLVSVLILPAAIIICLFSKEILYLWIRNPTTVEHTHLILSLLIVGTALNGLMALPGALQLAHGWTTLAFSTNVVSVIVLTPLIVVLTLHYGAVGAALVWVILNSGYVLICVQIMHRRLLPGEQWRWYLEDVGKPLVAAILTAGVGRVLLSGNLSQSVVLACLICISVATLSMSVLAAPHVRASLFDLSVKSRERSYEF